MRRCATTKGRRSVAPPLFALSLFSGGGGLDLGLEAGLRQLAALAGRAVCGVQPVAYVEREAYAAAVLLSRMEEGALAPGPVWTDVSTLDGRRFRGLVDVVLGGSPCQDLSVAGLRRGLDGAKSGLFWHFARIVEECQPGLVFWENVGGAARELPRVFDAFAERGYRGAAIAVRASDVGAPHRRRRLFVLAHRDGGTRWLQQWRRAAGTEAPDAAHARSDVANGNGNGCAGERRGGVLDGERATRGDDADGCGGAGVVDSSGERGPERRDGVRARQSAVTDAGGDLRPGEWPPGPDDVAGWERVRAERPDLLPAQPRFRGVADGVAGWMDDDDPADAWADRLRLLGNGVVPAQAARAFVQLALGVPLT